MYNSASDEETAEVDQLDPSLQQKLNEQLSGLLNFSFTEDENVEARQDPESTEPHTGDADGGRNVADGDAEETGEEAFTFRLFRDEDLSRKVVLGPQDEKIGKGDGAFIAKRPMSYYLAEEPSSKVADELNRAAVNADYLLQDAGKRRWGLEKPWKVTTITITTNKRMRPPNSRSNDDLVAEARKKKRPGKKRRIILRVREKVKKEQEEAAKRQAVDKEEHLKEKKKRLNRQKKLKRRAKEREKKQGTNGNAASEPSSRESSPDQEND